MCPGVYLCDFLPVTQIDLMQWENMLQQYLHHIYIYFFRILSFLLGE